MSTYALPATNFLDTPPPASTLSPMTVTRRRSNVLRSPALFCREQPARLGALLPPLLAEQPEHSPGAWVLAGAEEYAARRGLRVPQRWTDKLAAALEVSGAPPAFLRETLARLPESAWHETALFGEIFSAVRDSARVQNKGHAGRLSVGCVYTPASVAREIVAEVHLGARRVVDPACGAGVFLLEAFARALGRRLENGATPREAAEAALAHELAGVDVDAQALAVAEFSLRCAALASAGLDADVPLDLRLSDALLPLPGLDGQCECIVGNPPFIEGRGLEPAYLDILRARFQRAVGQDQPLRGLRRAGAGTALSRRRPGADPAGHVPAQRALQKPAGGLTESHARSAEAAAGGGVRGLGS